MLRTHAKCAKGKGRKESDCGKNLLPMFMPLEPLLDVTSFLILDPLHLGDLLRGGALHRGTTGVRGDAAVAALDDADRQR